MSDNDIKPARRFAVKKDADNHYIGMEVHSLGAYVLYGEHHAAIDRLMAERDAYAANAARLQFCVNHDSFPTLARNAKTWVLFLRTSANRRSSFFGNTSIEAIDKAMAKEFAQ